MTEHGDFSYDPEARKLRGIVLPFGELSRTSVSGADPVMFGADSIDLPRDPSVITLNREHNRHDPVGRAVFLEKRREGVYAEFAIADTDEGDDYLARGNLRKLSAEVAGIVRDGAKAIKARLTGAALVTEGLRIRRPLRHHERRDRAARLRVHRRGRRDLDAQGRDAHHD